MDKLPYDFAEEIPMYQEFIKIPVEDIFDYVCLLKAKMLIYKYKYEELLKQSNNESI